MHNEEQKLPDTLHLAYFSGMVIMPHCSCTVVLSDKNAETAKMAYQSSSEIGLVQMDYKKKKLKKGCFAQIKDLTYPKKGRTDLVKLHITGVARFISEQFIKVPNYDHTCAYVNYDTFNDIAHRDKMIDLDNLNPILAKYFLSFIMDTGPSLNAAEMANISMDKFINSLIMIMPMSNEERKLISELKTIREKELALSTIMQLNEYNLTQTDIAH